MNKIKKKYKLQVCTSKNNIHTKDGGVKQEFKPGIQTLANIKIVLFADDMIIFLNQPLN